MMRGSTLGEERSLCATLNINVIKRLTGPPEQGELTLTLPPAPLPALFFPLFFHDRMAGQKEEDSAQQSRT